VITRIIGGPFKGTKAYVFESDGEYSSIILLEAAKRRQKFFDYALGKEVRSTRYYSPGHVECIKSSLLSKSSAEDIEKEIATLNRMVANLKKEGFLKSLGRPSKAEREKILESIKV